MSDVLLLDSSRAAITTASVTIKTLRVDNRQFTKSIFGQLPTCELFDDMTLEVNGTIWGHVNVCPVAEERGLTQFVIQRDGKLFRAPQLLTRLTTNAIPGQNRHAGGMGMVNCGLDQAATAWFILDVMTPRTDGRQAILGHFYEREIEKSATHYIQRKQRDSSILGIKGLLIESALEPIDDTCSRINRYLRASWHQENNGDFEMEFTESERDLKLHLNALAPGCFDADRSRWEEIIENNIRDQAFHVHECISDYNALMDRLEKVDQLYIAG